ncbi:MAG: L-serine ammonia-lyase, iron-sulfur-dependent, subunit alpha [Thermanaerothrix sp.]|nr:L-serine ammonia-lyase, iron-sulfur-dependent, subunit alpha [Thermanaerothrix sp.]
MTISLKEFLRREVRPALGCTEPGAVALSVARACEELSDREHVAAVRVTVSSSIYKNGMAVGIPGANGAKGNPLAAALGALVGKSSYGLEALKDTTEADVERARAWVEDERVSVVCDPGRAGVYVLSAVFTPSHKAVCLVMGSHDRIAKVMLDGRVVYEEDESASAGSGALGGDHDLPEFYPDVFAMLDQMDLEDQEFLFRGVEMNMAVAEVGLSGDGRSLGMGRCIMEASQGDLGLRIRATATAAADSRMWGVQMPVMSSAGSGNHGITAILPVAMLGKELGCSREQTARALALSHLSTSFVKRRLGRLSPVCGCSVAAGAGAAAGMCLLLGGDVQRVQSAMEMVLANLAGMLCDGAKESCALKVGTGSHEAYLAARMAASGLSLCKPQGVLSSAFEASVENVARVNQEGMRDVDKVIIGILDRSFAGLGGGV